jgi:uracil phosphoribosyltransferase
MEIETPLETMKARVIDGKKLCSCPSCARAWACWTACSDVVPGARVGHIGLYRDPKTLAKLKVAAIYTVPVEQQWVSRIHKALKAAEARGEIEYVPARTSPTPTTSA